MKAIIGYIIDMIPFMLIAIPIYLIIRFFILTKKASKINRYHEIVLFLFIIFLVGLASQTIIPKFEYGSNGFEIVKNGVHNTNLTPFKVLVQTYNSVFINGNLNYFIINFLGNIILFIPFGFVIPMLWNISNIKVIAIGFLSSFFIEFCQMFLTRGTDIDDLILNTIGTCIGLLLYKFINKQFNSFIKKHKI